MFNKTDIFPSHLWTLDFDDHSEYKKSFVEGMYQLQSKIPSKQVSNNGGWQSPNLGNSIPIPFMDPFFDYMFTKFGEIFKEGSRISIVNMWANINPPGSSNLLHCHPGADYVGTFYILAPNDSGDLTLISPNLCSQASYLYSSSHAQSCENYHISPEEGMFLMFPSNIYHCVGENKSNDNRISLAINFNIVHP